jgi:hypothetical protein
MLEHLRRLAPRRPEDGTRAVAAVPSRFARPTPLRVASIAATWAEGRDDDQRWPLPAAGGDERSLPVEQAMPAAETSSGAVDSRRLIVNALSSAPMAFDLRSLRATARARDPGSPPQRADVDGAADAGSAARGRDLRSALASATLAPDTARAAPGTTPGSGERHRSSRMTIVPPAIHVTIDRIEVRAPPVEPRKKSARAPREGASATSLADYLRGSGKGRQR